MGEAKHHAERDGHRVSFAIHAQQAVCLDAASDKGSCHKAPCDDTHYSSRPNANRSRNSSALRLTVAELVRVRIPDEYRFPKSHDFGYKLH
jgi:hypothetical protein